MAFFDYAGVGLYEGHWLGNRYETDRHAGDSMAHFVLGYSNDIQIVGVKRGATLYQNGQPIDLAPYEIPDDLFGDGFDCAYHGTIGTHTFTIVQFEDGVAVHLKNITDNALWEGYTAYGRDPYKYCGRI